MVVILAPSTAPAARLHNCKNSGTDRRGQQMAATLLASDELHDAKRRTPASNLELQNAMDSKETVRCPVLSSY